MKCISCGADSKYKERTGRKCSACNRPFAFEPREGDKFTDQAFQNAIDRVSAKGQVKFLLRNLFYEVDRMRKPRFMPWFWVSLVFLIFSGSAYRSMGMALFFFALSGSLGLCGFIQWNKRKRVTLTDNEFEATYKKWKAAHGNPVSLFQPPKHKTKAPSKELSTELAHYSFDRAVITDRRETAELLLANNFHFENNCAVLSFDGFPENAFTMVRQMLRNNPRIEVFALHDCSTQGLRLPQRLREDPNWFKDTGQVFDVALVPSQARKMKGSWLPVDDSPAISPTASKADRTFLSRYSVELLAIRPEQLVKRLFRAISKLPEAPEKTQQLGDGGDGGTLIGSDFSSDASASDGGADAFG